MGSYTNPIALQAQGGNNDYKQNDLWMTGAIRITPLEGLIINADYTFNMYNKGSKQHVQSFTEYKAVAGTEGVYPWTNPSSVVMTNNEDYYTAFNATVKIVFVKSCLASTNPWSPSESLFHIQKKSSLHLLQIHYSHTDCPLQKADDSATGILLR